MPTVARLLRRLPRSALVALATAAVFGGLLGTVQATDGTAAGDDDHLRLTSPALGDRWTYQAIVTGTWNFGEADEERAGTPFPYAEFAWVDPILVRDADGGEVAADVLEARMLAYYDDPDSADRHDGQLWVPTTNRHLVRLGTTEAFAIESDTASGGPAGGSEVGVVGPVTVLNTDTNRVVQGVSRYLAGGHAPCLSRTPMQDGPEPLGEPLVFPPDCLPDWDDEGWDWDDHHDSFTFAARELLGGHETVRFDSGDESIWFSPDVPVPVQWTGGDGQRQVTITLSSYAKGSTPLGSLGPVAGASVAPAVELAPRQPWGPDDSGVDHPFPASTAWRAALDDPAWPDFRQWMAAHPKGATFNLEYSEDLDSIPQQRGWTFVVGDGTGTFVFAATQSRIDALPQYPSTVSFRNLSTMSFFWDMVDPDPDALPADLPSVASVTSRWQSYEQLEGRDPTPNGWGLWMMCILDCSYGLYGEVVAGRDPVATWHLDMGNLMPTVQPADVVGRAFTGAQLNVLLDGGTKALVNWTGYDQGLAPDPLDGQGPVDTTPEPAPKARRPLVLASAFLPTPEQGAAITLASAFAGLLYWLWPSLKGGSFAGLFSRLHGPALLQHPSRRRLMDLVQAEPGIHFQDLVRKSGLANGTAVHHMHKLTQAGLVSARPLGRYTCYFPGSSIDRATLAAAPVTRSDGARRILAELAANPGLSGQEVAVRLGLQHSTVSYHVKRLQDVGLVAGQRDGRVVRLRTVARA